MQRGFLKRAQFLTNLFDAIPSMLFIVDDDVRVIHLNAAAKKIYGTEMLHANPKSGGEMLNCIHANETPGGCGRAKSCKSCVIRRTVKEASQGKKLYRLATKMMVLHENGVRDAHIMVTASPFAYENESLVLLIMEDVTEQKENENKLKQLNELLERRATTDMLTGIYNRLRFNEFLDREISEVLRYPHPLALIMFDIDNFKKINDTYGHHTGDRVLQDLVKVLSANIRETDVFARWGGEEFMILSPYMDVEHSIQLAEKLRSVIEVHRFDGPALVTSSFGVTQFDVHDTAESLIARVDTALYQAKAAGRNRVVLIQAAPVKTGNRTYVRASAK
jgi:diguanylate cyclase (GGDEF)-like protein